MELLKHEKVKRKLIDGIVSGEFEVGDKLPAVRKLAELNDVSVGSANRATLELADEGILKSIPGRKGLFVFKIPKARKIAKKNAIAFVHEGIEYHPGFDFMASYVLLDEMKRVAYSSGIEMNVFSHTPVDKSNEDSFLLEELLKHKFIFFWGHAYIHWAKFLESRGCFSLYFSYVKLLGGNWIYYDREEAVSMLMERLIAGKDEKVGLFCSSQAFSNDKFKAYRKALLEYGACLDMGLVEIVEEDSSLPAFKACQAMIERLGKENMPSAILVDSDIRAVGVAEALIEAGFKIPEDILLAGMDCWRKEARLVGEKLLLTTAGPDYDVLASEIIEIAQDVIDGKPPIEIKELTPCKFFNGETTVSEKISNEVIRERKFR